jgi:hypothetical protein
MLEVHRLQEEAAATQGSRRVKGAAANFCNSNRQGTGRKQPQRLSNNRRRLRETAEGTGRRSGQRAAEFWIRTRVARKDRISFVLKGLSTKFFSLPCLKDKAHFSAICISRESYDLEMVAVVLRFEDGLKSASNFIPWKARVTLILMENGLWYFANKIVTT